MAPGSEQQTISVADAKQALRNRAGHASEGHLLALSKHHPVAFPLLTFTAGFFLGSRKSRMLLLSWFYWFLGKQTSLPYLRKKLKNEQSNR